MANTSSVAPNWQLQAGPRILRIFRGDGRTAQDEVCCIFDSTPNHHATARLIVAAPQLEQLVREAYDAFVNPLAPIDLRDWIRSAEQALGIPQQGDADATRSVDPRRV